MSQIVDFSIEKLSAPIEELNLDQRTRHLLKRGNIHTVSEIIAVGKSHILSMKHIGSLIANRVFSAVANFLCVPEERLFSEEIRQIVLSQPRQPSDPLSVSVTVLNLSKSITHSLITSNIFRISELLRLRADDYSRIGHLPYVEVRKIDRELSAYLARIPLVNTKPLLETNAIIEPSIIKKTSKVDLGLILRLLEINERAWRVVELRAMRLLTLEEIATEIGGVTRERVRQIIEQVNEKVRKKYNLLVLSFDYFEEKSKDIQKTSKNNNLDLKTLINRLKPEPLNSNLVAEEKELEQLIALVRMLVLLKRPWMSETIEQRWKAFTFLSCGVDPTIGKNKKAGQLIEKEEKEKKLTYRELAYLVLSKAERPLHWSDIAKEAYKISNRDSFETRALYHALLEHEELFVRVGQGTYELVEWGNKAVEPYPDIVASILKKENCALPFDPILARVSSVRLVKQTSLIMFLEMHPRFYKSINNTYGLRGWLPPREKQNLRTPEWLIEESKSFERVERARIRGYDIAKLIADDMLQ